MLVVLLMGVEGEEDEGDRAAREAQEGARLFLSTGPSKPSI